MKKQEQFSMPFFMYLDNFKSKKFAAIISRKQYAIELGNDHIEMLNDLLNRTKLGIQDTYKDNIIALLGENNYMYIDFQNMKELNTEQYDCLFEILYSVKSYIENNNIPIELRFAGNNIIIPSDLSNNIPVLYEYLKQYTSNNNTPLNETIIGREFEVNEIGSASLY